MGNGRIRNKRKRGFLGIFGKGGFGQGAYSKGRVKNKKTREGITWFKRKKKKKKIKIKLRRYFDY